MFYVVYVYVAWGRHYVLFWSIRLDEGNFQSECCFDVDPRVLK